MSRLAAAVAALALLTTGCDTLVTAPSDLRLIAIAAGGAHTCGLDESGVAWCWGANGSGQLGVSRRHDVEDRPVAVHTGKHFRAITAGERHTCALDFDDRAWCWGGDDSGQLGDGSFDDRDEPVVLLAVGALSSIAAGASHTCAIDRGGAVWCWGRNDRGQSGPGPTVMRAPLRLEQAPLAGAIAAGGSHSCALSTAGAFCWGANDRHQLGGGTGVDSALPVRVSAGGVLETLAAGRAHSCGVTADGRVLCWGSNEEGQAGEPFSNDVGTAFPVPTVPSGITGVTAGPAGDYSCAVGAAGAWCWGAIEDAVLGVVATIPTRITGLPSAPVSAIAAGDGHACALVTGQAWCWGTGTSGQLGNGARRSSMAPVQVGSAAG